MIGPSIRLARKEDLQRICEIALKAWVPVYEGSYRQIMGDEIFHHFKGSWREDKAAQIRKHFADHADWMLVVEKENLVVAFIAFWIDQDKSCGAIRNNAVAPEAQGQGIAVLMYQHVLECFRKKGLKYALVKTGLDPASAPARRSYEKAGFNVRMEDVTYYMNLKTEVRI